MEDRWSELFRLYMESYWHELNERSSILKRVQISFAFILAYAALWGYLLQQPFGASWQGGLYWVLFLFSLIPAFVAVAYFVKATAGGYAYHALPAGDLEQYRTKLKGTHPNDWEERFWTNLQQRLGQYIKVNQGQNVVRNLDLFRTNYWLIVAFVPAFFCYLLVQISS